MLPETEFVDLKGRDAILSSLSDFVQSKNENGIPVKWWLITGGAGSGKTRLTTTFCRRMRDCGWISGFLYGDLSCAEKWIKQNEPMLEKDKGLFLVFDYCSSRADEIQKFITDIVDSQPTISIRIILLERSADDPWFTESFMSTGGNRTKIKQTQHKEPLSLKEQENDFENLIWPIVIEYFERITPLLKGMATNTPNKDEFGKNLRAIDPNMRPLSAMLVADHIAYGGLNSGVNLTDFLSSYISRNWRNFWGAVERDDKHVRLFCLATLCQGLPTEIIDKFNDREGAFFGRSEDLNSTTYRTLSGFNIDDYLVPLKPDLIGEYFFIDYLRDKNPSAKLYASIASKFRFFETIAFLELCSRDFPEDLLIKRLFLSIKLPEKFEARIFYGMAAVNQIGRCGDIPSDQIIQIGTSVLDKIKQIAEQYPEEPPIRELWAQGAVNLIVDYGNNADIQTARDLLNNILRIAEQYPEESPIREQWAKGAFNLIVDYGNASDIPTARDLLNDILRIAEQHPEEPPIRELWAKGAFNMINNHSNAGDIQTARDLLDDILRIAEQYPEEPPIRELWAKGAVNLIVPYGNNGDIPTARDLLNDILRIAEQYPEEPPIREQWARGAVNLIVPYGNNGDIPTARDLLNDILRIAERHPEEPPIRELWAKGAVNLIVSYGNNADIPTARDLLDDILRIAEQYPEEPPVRELWAQGAFNLIVDYGNAGDIPTARDLLDHILRIAEQYPEEPPVRLEWAQGAVNLIVDYGNAGDIPTARDLLQSLIMVWLKSIGNQQIAEITIRGLYAFCYIAAVTNNEEAGKATLKEFSKLGEDSPQLNESLVNIVNEIRSKLGW